jgi:hypothetical protein
MKCVTGVGLLVGKVAVSEPVAAGGVELAIGSENGDEDGRAGVKEGAAVDGKIMDEDGRAEADEMEDKVGWAEDEVDEDGSADKDGDGKDGDQRSRWRS